ncbi:MAG: SAM-dependent methyltransferase, partial [Microcoleaceae cyanobacterium]
PGSEAVLSILCLKAGAEKVYAIEYLQDTYEKARSKIESLGLENQIIVIHGDAMKTKLPEKVDYCISEIFGGIGGLEGAAAIINNAHRFLKDSSHVIPQKTITKISALSLAPNRKIGFVQMAADYVERIFSHKGYRFDLRLRIKNVDKEDLCSSQGIFEDLDYRHELPLEHEHEIHLEFFKEGLCHGFLVWLTIQFDEENHLDVLESEDSWRPIFLPIWKEGILVSKGDVIEAKISRCLGENGLNPDYRIVGKLVRISSKDIIPFEYESFHDKQIYCHNPFYAELFGGDSLPMLESFSITNVKDFLHKRIPEHMIPQSIITVKNLATLSKENRNEG